jgi:methylated-DNA-protein-cysteine methyltransferase-like protein
MPPDPKYRERVFKIVCRIPAGRVMTYGQIAELLGEHYTARTVGFVMHGAGDSVPWHRVINARGSCSTGGLVLPHDKQQRMREAEGVRFTERGCCNLETYLWLPEFQSASPAPKKEKRTLFRRPSTERKRR